MGPKRREGGGRDGVLPLPLLRHEPGDTLSRRCGRIRGVLGGYRGTRGARPPGRGLAADRAAWTHLTDYAACRALAEEARAIGARVIRYLSVRDPAGGANLAVLSCRAFATPQSVERQTWRIRIGPAGAQALREHPRLGLEFPTDSFAPDPRLEGMLWDRPRAR
jgi:hypothetical protein